MIVNSSIYQVNLFNSKTMGINKESNKKHVSEYENIQDEDLKNESNIWTDLKKEYDIRNASFDELYNVSSALYNAGEISLIEHGTLTFNPDLSPQKTNDNYTITQPNEQGKMDWIIEFEARAQRDLKLGNYQGYVHKNNLLKVLNNLV